MIALITSPHTKIPESLTDDSLSNGDLKPPNKRNEVVMKSGSNISKKTNSDHEMHTMMVEGYTNLSLIREEDIIRRRDTTKPPNPYL